MDIGRTGSATIAIFGLLVLAAPAPAATVESAKVDALIRLLGADGFAEREAAEKALMALGKSALPGLRRAALRNADAEIQRRAERLVPAIEKKADTADILQPTLVKLSYKDTPIPTAVRDFAKRAGYADRMALYDPIAAASRKITLETPEIPFWEALDRFCEKAELTHVVGAQLNTEAMQTHSDPIDYDQVVLVDGKPRRVPTCYSGAVRIRAMLGDAVSYVEGQPALPLEIIPEPKVTWYGHEAISLNSAVDDRFRPILQAFSQGDDLDRFSRKIRRRSEFIVGKLPSREHKLCLGALQLQLPDHSGKIVRSLKGVIEAKVETPQITLLTVEDVLRGERKTYRGKDDSSITIAQIQRLADGKVRLRFRLTMSSERVGGVDHIFSLDAGAVHVQFDYHYAVLILFDDQGRGYSTSRVNGFPLPQEWIVDGRDDWEVEFYPPTKESVPRKLEWRGSRQTTIDIPFEFKEVPLP